MAIAEIVLDRQYLRRIRGKLDEPEMLKAMELADQDIRTWFRRLFGAVSRDEELEIIEDSNSDPLDVAEEVIANYEANPDHVNWKVFKDLAGAIASSFAMEWADFMAGDADPAESEQFKATQRMVTGRKKRLEAVTFVTLTDGTKRYFQRFYEHKGMVVKKRSRA